MTPKILFYVNYSEGPTKADYAQHPVISCAEGLKKLNIPFHSNINHYKYKDGTYLFQEQKNINHDDYELIITSPSCGLVKGNYCYPNKTSLMPKEVILNLNRKYKTVMLDMHDGFMPYISNSKYFDYYFITSYHENVIKKIGNNIYPLTFGTSNRFIEATKNDNNFSNRTINLLYSHRVNHPIRKYMLDHVYNNFTNLITHFNDNFKEPNENDEHYLDWCQSGRRHNPNYYEALKNSKMVDCTGGLIKSLNNFGYIYSQFDSWKLWETFFAGACVIMIDLDYFGIKVPAQPINMKHYIGITQNKDTDNAIFKDIINEKIDIKKIAEEGKKWAIENYSPDKIAKYILHTCRYGEKKDNNIDIASITNFKII